MMMRRLTSPSASPHRPRPASPRPVAFPPVRDAQLARRLTCRSRAPLGGGRDLVRDGDAPITINLGITKKARRHPLAPFLEPTHPII